jgi:hypothetical protein
VANPATGNATKPFTDTAHINPVPRVLSHSALRKSFPLARL